MRRFAALPTFAVHAARISGLIFDPFRDILVRILYAERGREREGKRERERESERERKERERKSMHRLTGDTNDKDEMNERMGAKKGAEAHCDVGRPPQQITASRDKTMCILDVRNKNAVTAQINYDQAWIRSSPVQSLT